MLEPDVGLLAPAAGTAIAARPLSLGPFTVDPPVVLAPMAGVTDAPFRVLCASFGGGLFVNQMVTARALLEGHADVLGPDPLPPGRTHPLAAALRHRPADPG